MQVGDLRWPGGYLPELRPDTPVVTRRYFHAHPEIFPTDKWPVHPRTGNPLPRKHVMSAEDAELHIQKSHGGQNRDDVHVCESIAKYIFFPIPRVNGRKADESGVAAVVDVHRLAMPLLSCCERIGS